MNIMLRLESCRAMDQEELAETFQRMYNAKELRENASKKARLLIERKFDRNKIAQDFLDII